VVKAGTAITTKTTYRKNAKPSGQSTEKPASGDPRMPRPLLTILAVSCCILCANTAHPMDRDRGPHNGATPVQSIAVRLWLSDSVEHVIEYPFVIDVSRQEKMPYAKRKVLRKQWAQEFDDFHADQERRCEAVYSRIQERFADFKPENRKYLWDALDHIKTWGEYKNQGELASPARYMMASPDGRYAVTSIDRNPVLLIDIANLAVRLLADRCNDPIFNVVRPAVAWSRDSKYLAFSPPAARKLFLFDLERMAVLSTRTVGPDVNAITWSRDGRQIAVFEWRNRRLTKNPLLMWTALLGHPVYLNDAVASVYQAHGDGHFSILLKRGVQEGDSPRVLIAWMTGRDGKLKSPHKKSDGGSENKLHPELEMKP
jgi:hypothetical protein